MRRSLKAWAAAVFVALVLSGCGRVTADIDVNEDGTYDLSLVMAASEADLKTAGQTADAFSRLLSEQFAKQPGIENFEVSEYQEDGYAGIEITGDDIPGDDAGLFGRGVVRADAEGIHFDLQYPITIITESFTPEQTAAVEISTTVSFPSRVTDTNGTLVDDSTVEWTGDGSTDLDYTATAEPVDDAEAPTSDGSDADEGSGWLLPLIVGLGVVLVAGAGVWVILRNRSNDGPGPSAPHQNQQWGPPPPAQPTQAPPFPPTQAPPPGQSTWSSQPPLTPPGPQPGQSPQAPPPPPPPEQPDVPRSDPPV